MTADRASAIWNLRIAPMLHRPFLFLLLLTFPLALNRGLHAQDPVRDGKIAFAKHNYKEALNLFQKAKSARPSDGEPYYYAGLVQERMGNKPSAMSEFRHSTELNMSADLKEKAFWKLVLYYRFVEDWENLHAVAQRFLALRPNPEVEKLRDTAEANLNPARRKVQKALAEGAEAEKKGRMAEALSHYAEAARLDPSNVKVLWKAADAYRKADRCAEALRLYRKALDVDASSWYSHYQSGVCLYHLEHFPDAIRSFDTAERLNEKPEASFRFYVNTGRGLSNLELERIEEADKSLRVLRENKALFAKSGPASILAAAISILRNDKSSIEPFLKKIGEQESDRSAIPVLRGMKAALSADFAAVERELDPLFADSRKGRYRLQTYTVQLLTLVAHHHALLGNTEEARKSLARIHSLTPAGEPGGAVFRMVLTNPFTPFREDQTHLAVAYARDLRLFAANAGQATDIVEGRLLFEIGKNEEARPILAKAKIDPLCQLYLGMIDYDAGDLNAARTNVKEALRRDPDLKRRIAHKQVLIDLVESPDPISKPPGDSH